MKFENTDKQYLEKRKELSRKYGERELWSVVDHWPLYCGIANLARNMAIADIFRSTLNVPGHIAEFGSWRGTNLLFLTKLLKIYDPHCAKEVHCFESFEGLQTFTEHDDQADSTAGSYTGSYEELIEVIALYELEDDITIHKGTIQDTLPRFIENNSASIFSFIYCDTDLFEPTEMILQNLHDHLSVGGVFVFDEYNDPRWPGETRAVINFINDFGKLYSQRHIRDTRQPTLVLKKIAN